MAGNVEILSRRLKTGIGICDDARAGGFVLPLILCYDTMVGGPKSNSNSNRSFSNTATLSINPFRTF